MALGRFAVASKFSNGLVGSRLKKSSSPREIDGRSGVGVGVGVGVVVVVVNAVDRAVSVGSWCGSICLVVVSMEDDG